MTGPQPPAPGSAPGLEPGFAAAFAQAGLDPAAFRYVAKPGPPTPLRTFVGEESLLTVAVDEDGRRRNLLEAGCRAWAGRLGVDGPAVLAAAPDGGWLHAERVRPLEPEGSAYVHAGLDGADRVASASSPPTLPVAASQWRAGPAARVASALRGTLGGLDVRRFLRSRRAAAALTEQTTCHGDYYRRNVLHRAEGVVTVVDWEFVGRGPRWTDHVRFWSTLRRTEDRREAWDRLSAGLTPPQADHLHTLADWLCHRLLAENLAAPRDQRDQADLRHARTVVAEVRSLSAGR